MPSRDDIHYFGAGPAPLPTSVLEEASRVLLNYQDSGIGLTEISHRSPEASAILKSTKSSLRQILSIPESEGPDGYEILFLHGGGSGEFSAVVYHMVSIWVAKQWKHLKEHKYLGVGEDVVIDALRDVVNEKMKLDYYVTGSWSDKAAAEAGRLMGKEKVNIVTDARKHTSTGKFGTIPGRSDWANTAQEENVALTYYCDNETVDGVEFQSTPRGKNLIADMSSNFLSRPVDVTKYSAIFGGAQKNIGTTGITILIVSNALLPPHAETASPDLMRKLGLSVGPVVLDWPTLAKNGSLYNTLPIFDVWVAGRVMERLLKTHPGSIEAQEAESNQKAKMLYDVLDNSGGVYTVVPDKSVRSRMNLCLRVQGGDADAEKALLKGAEQRGLLGLKGHRSVGGIRISNYNAVPVKAVEKLRDWLVEFAKEQGKGTANGSA